MPIHVMIVDDSATVRTVLKMILEKDPDIAVIGVAANPDIALKKMQKEWPDVIVSDLEMPGMHGLDFLRYLKEHHPTPFVVCSSHVGPGAQASLDALALGAVDIIAKPNIGVESFLEEITASITQSVKAAAQTRVIRQPLARNEPARNELFRNELLRNELTRNELPRNEPPRITVPAPQQRRASSVIAVGSSTGGTTVVEFMLKAMTPDMPGVVIVQHMPKHFTELFAKRLNGICPIDVKEAADGDAIRSGLALIAPGGMQMKVVSHNNSLHVRVYEGEPVNRHRPSVDVLFRSVAEVVGSKAIGVILTGMGEDGAQGLLAMRKTGAVTIGQDQASSAVYGMPRVAMEIGAVEWQLSFTAIPDLIKQSLPAS